MYRAPVAINKGFSSRASGRWRPWPWGVLLCLLASVACALPVLAASVEVKQALHLASYHQGYAWTDDIQAGLAAALQASDGQPAVALQVEYLDAKRIFDENHQANLVRLLGYKYGRNTFDVIVVSDDDAFEFMKRHGQELFPGTPWVFCGVNNFAEPRLAGTVNVTGVAEDVDFERTVEAALMLFPKMRRLAVVSDGTTVGMMFRRSFGELWPKWESRLELIDLAGLSLEELGQRLEALPDHTPVLFLSFLRESTGHAISLREVSEALPARTKAPIFTCWSFVMGKGALGGMITDGRQQGRAAGEMALRVLRGERPEDIPVMRESPNSYIFDYRQMERFGLSIAQLPASSEVINRPTEFFERHQGVILAGLGVGLAQLAIIIFLLINRQRRQRAEDALRESERRYRELFDGIGDLLYTQDMEGKFLSINRASLAIFGYAPDELIGRCAAELMLPEHRQGFFDEYLPRLRERGYYDGIGVYRAKDGRRTYIEFRSNLVRAEGKEPIISGVARDVSERKAAERALKLSEERYRKLFDSISDFIYTHDLQGRFLTINRTACQALGYEPGEIVGKPVSDLMAPELRQAFHDRYLPDILAQGEAAGVSRYLAKNGDVHFIEFRNHLVREPDQQPYVSGSGRDVTRRFQAERELRRLEEQLVQAQKMEAVGVLAGGVAHDFNNILQAISGYIQLLLRDSDLASPQKDYLSRMEQSLQRAADLVNRLLTFSRKAERSTKLVDLNLEIEQVLKLLERTIPKMINLEARLSPGLHSITADPNQLEQVLLNLVSNASDAMPEGGVLLFETANAYLDGSQAGNLLDLPPGDYVELKVSDTGHGMTKETLEHVFEPFFTTKDIGKGTGLGLATVYGIIKSHGGQITCASRPGQGATFTIHLPVATAREQNQGHHPQPTPELRGGGETLLLVDDEMAVLEVAQSALQDLGYRVVTATCGEEALEEFVRPGRTVDLVILDLGMPGMGGRRCLQEMLRLRPEAKVIIASGYNDLERIGQARRDGAADFIGKPYRLDDLLHRVRALLDQPSRGVQV